MTIEHRLRYVNLLTIEKSATCVIASLMFPETISGNIVESAPLQYNQKSPAVSFTITDILLRSIKRSANFNNPRFHTTFYGSSRILTGCEFQNFELFESQDIVVDSQLYYIGGAFVENDSASGTGFDQSLFIC